MRTLVIATTLAIWGVHPGEVQAAERVGRVADLDVGKISQSLERPRTTGPKSAVAIGGIKFERSIATRAASRLYIELDGQEVSFSALINGGRSALLTVDLPSVSIGRFASS